MKMAFHVGQKVECVDDSPKDCEGLITDTLQVKKGTIYHISKICNGIWGSGVLLSEVKPSPGYWAFQAKRFRAIVEQKTDISIFTTMLKPKGKIRIGTL